MNKKFISFFRHIKYLCPLTIIFFFLLAACTDNEESVPKFSGETTPVSFVGRILEDRENISRAPVGSYITRTEFDTKFYIDMETEGKNFCGSYLISQTTNGILHSFNNADSLNWHYADKGHTFHAWTMPWTDDSYLIDKTDKTLISFNQDHEMYSEVTDNENCKVLEGFIGAKTGPVTFIENGEFVALQFQHLVSKIRFLQVNYNYLDENNEFQTKQVSGVIRFMNMPSEAIFTRLGDDRPIVVGNTDSEPATYNIANNKWIYICPDVDFSNVEFRIAANDEEFGSVGEFLGDFKSVKFVRNENDWWDIQRPSPTTLYAGEEMTLKMTLVRGGGVFVKVSISPWATQDLREGTSYPYQGIFSNADLNHFYNTFNQTGGYTEENEEYMFNLYGEYDENGNPEYRLYDDFTINLRRVPMGTKCWLNGMGHTLTLTHPTPYGPDQYGERYYGFSRMKDIYIADNQGHMLYIDKDFKVWIVNEDGSMKEALDDNGVQYEMAELTGRNRRYYVDIITGKVTQVT